MLQFHRTVSLTLIVTLGGEKKLSPTVTVVVAAKAAGEMLTTRNKPARAGNHLCGTKHLIVFIFVWRSLCLSLVTEMRDANVGSAVSWRGVSIERPLAGLDGEGAIYLARSGRNLSR